MKMSQRFRDSIVEEIRLRNDIVDVISEYVPLKRDGKNYKSKCPFHNERTPSFKVSPDKQMFYCFGCGAGGDVFSFIMKHERMEFIDALEVLAKRGGIILPKEERKKQDGEIEKIYDACEFAMRTFVQNLKGEEGKRAREYLKERGINTSTQEEFQIGYSLPVWEGLINSAKKEGISVQSMERAGLLIPRDGDSGCYDRFRGRVMFPIFNLRGKVIAFGGRSIEDGDAKYINSPETPIYQKGRNFFGLYHTKHEIQREEKAILVEGYMDFLSLYQAGIKNLVASLGTALTSEQAKLMARYVPLVIILYDSDDAGVKASLRAMDILLSFGLDVEVVSIPSGMDPDNMIKKFGKNGFYSLFFEKKLDFLDFKIKWVKENYNFETSSGKSKGLHLLLETVGKIEDRVRMGVYIQRLSKIFGLPVELLLQSKELREKAKSALNQVQGQDEKITKGIPSDVRLEREIVKLMLRVQDGDKKVREILGEDNFVDPASREIVSAIFQLRKREECVEVMKIMNLLESDEAKSIFAGISLDEKEEDALLLEKFIYQLNRRRERERLENLRKEIKRAEEGGAIEKLKELQERYFVLKRKGIK